MQFVENSEIPPISFRYGGKDSGEMLTGWPAEIFTEINARGELTHRSVKDPATGLKVTVHTQKFNDFSAVEWLAEIENTGVTDTPLIEDILALDVSVPIPDQERLRLHYANGSACRLDDFLPQAVDLSPHVRQSLSPVGGRSSNGVFPFMNLQRKDCGLVLAIGWSGQWQARFERGSGSLRVTAGMERTRLRLHPGEKIRTPRILLVLWEGDDPEIGNNQIRRILLSHYLPRINDQLVTPPTAQCLQAYFYLTGEASERFEMKALPKVAAAGADAYWIDACWYGEQGQQWWEAVGSWVINRERFPHGLKPISDAAHKAGMKFVLWFEPERVRPNSLLHREHPEFLLACEQDATNLLYNLGMPDARQHLTDLISQLIDENGVDIYRQDFNFDPLPYWWAADEDDRIGMTEIRYVDGLYVFWDEIRRRHPALWIDNCASGGRRIDLETLSRSLPLWPSDFHDVVGLPFGGGLDVGNQCINAGLARWVPLFGGGVWNFTPYSIRSGIIGGFNFGFHIEHGDFPPDDGSTIVSHIEVLAKGKTLLDDDFPLDDARSAIAEWRSLQPFFLGDFHLLLPLTISYHDWCAYQFHRSDMEAGFALFFRRHRSPFPTMEIGLRSIIPDAQYEVSLSTTYQEAPNQRLSGKQLTGMSIEISEAPGSLLMRYNRVATK